MCARSRKKPEVLTLMMQDFVLGVVVCVDVENFTYLPDDFEDMPASNRNESARARRRGHISPRVLLTMMFC